MRRTVTETMLIISVIVCRPAGCLTGGGQGGAVLTPFPTRDLRGRLRQSSC